MARKLVLSVVDQSPIHDGGGASQALNHSVQLAQLADRLGYKRYWVAEHHNTPGYACPGPEIMMATVARETEHIRVGSGGVMLTHYSPFKVAETFRLLSALNPGRIDLSVGRAPGADQLATDALSFPRSSIDTGLYAEQVAQLMGHLYDDLPEDNPYRSLITVPADAPPPEFWMLGSSGASAELAGMVGSGFVLALFINTHRRTSEITDAYRKAFKASAFWKEPQVMIGAAVICADTRERAQTIATSRTMWLHRALDKGIVTGLPSPEEAERLFDEMDELDRARYGKVLGNTVIGNPDDCRQQLEVIAEEYDTDEITVVAVTYHLADRLRSYELLADVCEIGR